MKILTLDPSLAETGWAVLDIQGLSSIVVMSGMIKTVPDRRRVRKSEGNFVRAEHIASFLASLVREHGIRLITMELPAGSQNAAAASCIALSVGVVAGLCGAFGLAYASVTPAELKRLVTGARDAAKEQVQDMVERTFPGCFANITTKAMREAIGDAIGAYLACKEDPIVRAVINP